ncbi:hypothetical protein DFP72DRAFT_812163 [Ephemerocybe angulata]|uniref:Tyrosinase copper-binding domain-containing protein n=1 Tax=Ephemerocybe angulata TaxID=980116 RepID=A0A8H6M6R6_9AGAR|nr:hypothetical protein DFP72DRAFT_812163 [Tulosesus angulatus]
MSSTSIAWLQEAEHCLVRGMDESWRRAVMSANVVNVLQSESYEAFRLFIDEFLNPIHGGGHANVGGEMLNIYSAAADPIFYLHHANLDRAWWKWQEADKASRMYDTSGPTEQKGNVQVTLDFEMDFPALGPNITIRDVMDARTYPSCFTYGYSVYRCTYSTYRSTLHCATSVRDKVTMEEGLLIQLRSAAVRKFTLLSIQEVIHRIWKSKRKQLRRKRRS